MSTKNPIDLSIGYQNIDGLHSKTFSCKLPYIEKKFIHDIEILAETWDSCKHNKEINGYKIIKDNKSQKVSTITKGRSSGGIIIYCKNHLHRFIKKCLITPHYIWIDVNHTIFHSIHESIKICIAYNPPENSKYCNKNIYDDFSEILLRTCNTNTPFLLIGDLNSRTGDLTDYQDETDDITDPSEGPPARNSTPTERQNCDKKTNQMGIKLIDFCKAHDLQILNGRTPGDRTGTFTYYDTEQGASTIDLAIASDSLQTMIKSMLVQHQSEVSKHCKVVVRIKNLKDPEVLKEIKDEYPWIPTPKKYLWQDHSGELLARALLSPELESLTEELNQLLDAGLVEQASEKLTELYTKAADSVLEVKNTRRPEKHPYKHKQKPKKWYNDECRTLKNNCRRFAIMKKQNPEDTEIRRRHSMALKEYKHLCARRKYDFECNQIKELDQMLSEDHSEFWKKWKSFGDSYNSTKTPNVDGKRWETYFKKLYEENTSPDTLPPLQPVTANLSKLNAPFTIEELLIGIYKLKNKKAAGMDKLISEFLKASPEPIHQLVLRLLNTIYTKHLVPREKCLGTITPLHKEGPKDDPDNYRGICISSALTKLLGTMMNIRLNEFIQENQILHKEQIGFTTNNRCPDHIFTLRAVVNKYVEDQRGRVFACFIDFRKAFDTVWHNGLFYKLQQIGISGHFLETLKDIYKNTKCAVKLDNKLTQFFQCQKGVRQGDPLSPTLFNIFLNDLFKELRNGNCDPVSLDDSDPFNALAYADDIVLLSTSKEGLQRALDITEKYCESWRLSINHTKTKSMIFSKGNQKIKTTFKVNGKELENVKEFKYLGITVHKKSCSFTPTLNHFKVKATRALYALRTKININNLPLKVALKLFDAIIKPILLYGSEVWEPFLNQDENKWDQNNVEKVYTQFLKQVLGVNRSTTTAMVRGELNRHSLQEEILRRNINYAIYIQQKEGMPYVKQALEYEMQRNAKVTFFSTMDKHLSDLNQTETDGFFLPIPYANPYENINAHLSRDKQKLLTKEIFRKKWKDKINQSSKADTYRQFKPDMKFEPYLYHGNRKMRVNMTKLRVSDHKLQIETGRHQRPLTPRSERKCYMCSEEVEDETHFLTQCKLYGTRDKYWTIICNKVPQISTLSNTDRLIYLMTQEDQELTGIVMKMNYEWMQFRNCMHENFYSQ